jgi:hypothetical protein
VLRGGPSSVDRLRSQAHHTHDADALDGEPLWGVSVFGALDDVGPASLRRCFDGSRPTAWFTCRPLAGSSVSGSTCCRRFSARISPFASRATATRTFSGLLDGRGPARPNPYHASAARKELAVIGVDITCDLMDEDETGYVWTFPARGPGAGADRAGRHRRRR